MKEPEDNLNFDINLDSAAPSTDPNSQSIRINDTENKKAPPKEQKPQRVSSSDKIDFTNFLSQAKNPGIVFFKLFLIQQNQNNIFNYFIKYLFIIYYN